MKPNPPDPDRMLRDQFQALRRAEASRSPAYEVVRAATSVPGSRSDGRWMFGRRLAWSALVVLGLVSTVALWTHRSTQRRVDKAIAQARELQAWSAPTDPFLSTTDLGDPGESGASGSGSPAVSEAPATQPTNRPD
jgi:hypothetical protein